MFYAIKHIPTNTWVPQLKTPHERALYYHFLDNTQPPPAGQYAPQTSGAWQTQNSYSNSSFSNYSASLIGMTATNQKVPTSEELNFERGFKYQNKELAIGFVKTLATKLRNQGKSIDEIVKDFDVQEFAVWPIEHLKLNNKSSANEAPLENTMMRSARGTTTVNVAEVKDNWYGLSKIYCSKCGAYIPVKVRYLHVGTFNLCPECVKEVAGSIADEFDKYPDKELVEAIMSERFIAHL